MTSPRQDKAEALLAACERLSERGKVMESTPRFLVFPNRKGFICSVKLTVWQDTGKSLEYGDDVAEAIINAARKL